MLLFWKAKLAILAVPKTGTQAVVAALRREADVVFAHPPGLKHMPVRRFRRRVLPLFDADDAAEIRTVAVVRDPVDWLGSWYRYRRRPAVSGAPVSTDGLDFDTFVRDYLATPQPAHARLGSQARFTGFDGGLGAEVDHVFAYEDFDAYLDFLADRLGRPVQPRRHNVSPAAPMDLTAETRARLETDRAADFALHEAARAGRLRGPNR